MNNPFHWQYFFLFLIPSAGIYFIPYPTLLKSRAPGILLLLFFAGSVILGTYFASGYGQAIVMDVIQQLGNQAIQVTGNIQQLDSLTNWFRQIMQYSAFHILLIVSLLFIWIYFIVRSGFSIVIVTLRLILDFIVWLIDWVRKRLSRLFNSADNDKSVRSGTSNPPAWMQHIFFLQRACWIFLLIGAVPLASLPLWVEKPDIAPVVVDYFTALVWMGIWIVFLEAGSFLRSLYIAGDVAGSVSVTGEDVKAFADDTFIRQLFYAYQKRFADCLLGQRHIQQEETNPPLPNLTTERIDSIFQEQMPAHQAVQAQEIFDKYLDDKDVLISETLTYFHLLVYMEMIMHCIHHKGAVLVVAPPLILDDFKSELVDVIDRYYGRFSLRTHDWKEGEIEHHDKTDLHFCTVDELELYIGNTERVTSTELMLILHAHAIDKTLLRHESGRMELILEQHNSHLLKVAQMQEYYNDEQAIRSTLITEHIQQIKLIPETYQPPLTLVWNINEQAECKIKNQYFDAWPGCFNIAPLLFLNPLEKAKGIVSSAVWVDEEYRFDADLHEHHTNEQLIPKLTVCHLVEELRRGIQMIIIEDVNNIVFKMARNIQVFPDEKILLHIICHSYLLRDFMLEKARGRHDLTPRLGVVHGRKTDLAGQIIRALKANGKLGEQDIAELIKRSEFHQQIAADYQGLQKLFSDVAGIAQPLRCRVNQGKSEFYLAGADGLAANNSIKTVRLDGHEKLAYLSAAEHGLHYACGTLLLLKNKFYKIDAISDEDIRVSHAPCFIAPRPRPHYFFQRHYLIHLLHDISWQTHITGHITVKTGSAEVSYRRISRAYLEMPEYAVTDYQPDYCWFDQAIEYENHASSALIIRLTANHDERETIDHEKIEFTLAAVVQEIMVSIFPVEQKNIVVLPYHRQNAQEQPEQIDIDMFPLIMYPSLERTDAVSGIHESTGPDVILLMLEDSESDLGVVNYYSDYDRLRTLLNLANDYLLWAETREPDTLFHSYHQGRLPDGLDYPGLKQFLQCFCSEELTGQALLEPILSGKSLNVKDSSQMVCDFCGSSTDHYVTLSDQRIRCSACSSHAVDQVDEFRTQLFDVIDKMETNYHIELSRNLDVEMVNASTLHQRQGEAFIPSDAEDPRAIGFTTLRPDSGFLIVIENGFPEAAMRMTIAHELTHIWQFGQLGGNIGAIDLDTIEGQASFIEVEFARQIDNNRFLADQAERQLNTRNDCYGQGFRKIHQECMGISAQEYFSAFLRQMALR